MARVRAQAVPAVSADVISADVISVKRVSADSLSVAALLALAVMPVTVKPGAPGSAILGARNGTLHVAIAAPPEDGKANAELLRFLKKQTGFTYTLVSGASTRQKLVRRQ